VRSLYARVFLSFWIVTGLIVAGTIVVTEIVLTQRTAELPRRELVRDAALALNEGGEARLVGWLRAVERGAPSVRVLVFDERGRELLGRELPPWLERRTGAVPEPDVGENAEHDATAPSTLPNGLALALPEFAPEPGAPLGVRIRPAQQAPVLITPEGRRYGVLVLAPSSRLGPLGLPETRWAVLALALAVTGIASWLLTRSITAPVASLGAATRALAAGDLGARVAPEVRARRDELGVLGRDFDAMAGRLRELVEGKERLLRDISHELRSPLARMRVALGLAAQPGGESARHFERLELEIERLDGLIGHVLRLSRLDARAARLERERIDLGALVDRIARDAGFEGSARGVAIEWRRPAAPVAVDGDPPLLASAIENVVRNALRYTADGSAIEIEVASRADGASVLVRDRGPGVPEPELARIFEPFYRVTEARDRGTGGDGIGLAITARVMHAHGGTALARNRTGGGLEVELGLPAAAGDPVQRAPGRASAADQRASFSS
jgi:two-component system sensor histidine kinase CpxA